MKASGATWRGVLEGTRREGREGKGRNSCLALDLLMYQGRGKIHVGNAYMGYWESVIGACSA